MRTRNLILLPLLLASFRPASADLNAPIEEGADRVWERILSHSQGWGNLGRNRCAYQQEDRLLPLRIGTKEYESGFGSHAPGEIWIDLGGEYSLFKAEIGLQPLGHNQGTAVFKVSVDGELVFESGTLRETDSPRPIEIDVRGAEDLRLIVEDGGDGIACDCANWANPTLTRVSGAQVKRTETVDAAPFGTISTWDPQRQTGVKASRIQEFLAEDIRFATAVLPDASEFFWPPVTEEGLASIGVEWHEQRFVREVSITFADRNCRPRAENTKVQIWSGESVWQGGWLECVGEILEEDEVWTFKINRAENAFALGGTEKVRWVFSGLDAPVPVKGLSARTASVPRTMEAILQPVGPREGEAFQIDAYNGFLLNSEGLPEKGGIQWNPTAPLKLTVLYSETRGAKTDRTVLLFRTPAGGFGVSVDDLIQNECVYTPHANFFIKRGDSEMTLETYLERKALEKTTLERVREAPDQTLEQAFEKVHNPIQDLGPMMLSLACDNRKFVVYREGQVAFEAYSDHRAPPIALPERYRLIPQFGSGLDRADERRLLGEWLPIPQSIFRDKSISYEQSTYVIPLDETPIPDSNGWLYEKTACVAEFRIANPETLPGRFSLTLSLVERKSDGSEAPVDLKRVADGLVVAGTGGQLLACFDLRRLADAEVRTNSNELLIEGELPGGAEAGCEAILPGWSLAPNRHRDLLSGDKRIEVCKDYWRRVLDGGVRIETPNPLLDNILRASQVHILLAARNEEDGRRAAAWISSDRYGPLESEAHSIIRGMDFMGHDEFARRSLDFFVHRYSPEGFLTTGYTIMGTGWHLWTLAEHFFRTQDREWFQTRAEEIARVCRWIADQRKKTMLRDSHGEKVPEYGLSPPGVSADWNRFAYRFYQEGHYCAGLAYAASALLEVGYPGAAELVEEARDYRNEVLRAYHWTQERSPVVELADRTWRPTYPGMLFSFGKIEDIIPGEDASRSWAYDVELGAHHLAALEILDPRSEEVGWMMDHMEDFWFLHSGWFDYPEERNRADWYNLGGWGKVQPYYARNAEVYALRDDVKPFLRSYFNTIPTLLSLENLSFWEHFANSGGWNKTHETGYFLSQSRIMLVMERGNELWLAPMVSENWLRDGCVFGIEDAPTVFGEVSYRVESFLKEGFVEAAIQPPTRTSPEVLVLRLRAPGRGPIRKLETVGAEDAGIDPEGDTLRIRPGSQAIRIKAYF